MTPTSRTLAELRKRKIRAQVVEHWNAFARRRIDLFQVIDVVAVGASGIHGIQCCAGASHAARRTKALVSPALRDWLGAGGQFWIWSWSKRGARGKRKVWTLREERITTEMLP